MEIKLNIPENTYSVPTEVRPEVVQQICDAFLQRTSNSTFYPHHDGPYRRATLHVELSGDKGIGFINPDSYSTPKDSVRIRGCEMKAAFEALRQAGYHIFRVYKYITWLGYVLSEKPYHEGASEVYEFKDFID